MITGFSSEVIKQLDHYVYRLVDPRNGQTFYVGEGQGNRVFEHANAVSMDFYTSSAATDQDKSTEDNDDPAKIKKIIEIKSKGLQVIHIIQRFGMDKNTAFEVESAFIDFFGLQQLTNIQRGHHSDRGMRWTDELELELSAPEFEETESTPKFIIIKINQKSIELNDNNIYNTVRGHWHVVPKKGNLYPYVLAVKYGIVVGVYKIFPGSWKYSFDTRACFDGEEAPEEIKTIFLNKRVPEKYIRRQNPISYCTVAKGLKEMG